MGPSTVAGFNQQCRKCKALDTEIVFALGNRCPVDDAPPILGPEVPLPGVVVDPVTYAKLQVCVMQSNWFQGYCERQFNHLLQPQ